VKGDAPKISPRIHSPHEENAVLSILVIRNCKAMGDLANISPHVLSSFARN
jgi:hypothetical protein